jgi:hypothetical protein
VCCVSELASSQSMGGRRANVEVDRRHGRTNMATKRAIGRARQRSPGAIEGFVSYRGFAAASDAVRRMASAASGCVR